MERYDIINLLISRYGLKSYLEIGLNDPNMNYNHIVCEDKESCDPYGEDVLEAIGDELYEKTLKDGTLSYRMTSDDMFYYMSSQKRYDIIFIDGLHTEEQTAKDLVNSLKHLNPGGFVVMHDTLPERYARQLPEPSPNYYSDDDPDYAWNGTTWKVVPMLNMIPGISFHSVEVPNGCTIVQYVGNPENLSIGTADYDYMNVFEVSDAIRKACMHTITPDEFYDKYIYV